MFCGGVLWEDANGKVRSGGIKALTLLFEAASPPPPSPLHPEVEPLPKDNVYWLLTDTLKASPKMQRD